LTFNLNSEKAQKRLMFSSMIKEKSIDDSEINEKRNKDYH
jgi:hypothetical protein